MLEFVQGEGGVIPLEGNSLILYSIYAQKKIFLLSPMRFRPEQAELAAF